MSKILDPKIFGLSKSTKIQKDDDGSFVIIINRKSRIVMKDANSISKKTDKINMIFPNAKIKVKTNAPVCSKTEKYLKDQKGILIENIN